MKICCIPNTHTKKNPPVTMKWTTISLIHDGTLSVCASLCTVHCFYYMLAIVESLCVPKSEIHPQHTHTHAYCSCSAASLQDFAFRMYYYVRTLFAVHNAFFGWFWRFDIVSLWKLLDNVISAFCGVVFSFCSTKNCIYFMQMPHTISLLHVATITIHVPQ